MNFLGMGPMELVLIMVLALIVFGPGKLPEIAGQVGKMVRDFRNATSDMSSEFNKAFTLEADQPTQHPASPSVSAPPPPSLTSGLAASPPAPDGSAESLGAAQTPIIAPPSVVAAARSNDLQPPY